MPDKVKEKLVELLERAFESFIDDPYCIPDEKEFADHLIANDVGFLPKWISVKDRLPEEEGLYWVAVVNDHERKYSKTAWYHGHGNWFLRQKVTHWQYLPQPPKGE